MDIEGMKSDEQESEPEVNPMMELARAMQRLSGRITNVEVFIRELVTASSDEDSLQEFLEENQERAKALGVKIGSAETDEKADDDSVQEVSKVS